MQIFTFSEQAAIKTRTDIGKSSSGRTFYKKKNIFVYELEKVKAVQHFITLLIPKSGWADAVG